jgi:hypothetical protein
LIPIIVTVNKRFSGIVGRININQLYFTAEIFMQQFQRVKIVAFYVHIAGCIPIPAVFPAFPQGFYAVSRHDASGVIV